MKVSTKLLLKVLLLLPSLVSAGGVEVAKLDNLQGCKYMMDFSSSSTISSIVSGHDMHSAKKQIKRMAESMGATHVAWTSQTRAGNQITGKVYDC